MPPPSVSSGVPAPINIRPLLQRVQSDEPVSPDDIAYAISRIFTNQVSPAQTAVLLSDLATTGLDHRPDVLAECASAMRKAAEPVNVQSLRSLMTQRHLRLGGYYGGLVKCEVLLSPS